MGLTMLFEGDEAQFEAGSGREIELREYWSDAEGQRTRYRVEVFAVEDEENNRSEFVLKDQGHDG